MKPVFKAILQVAGKFVKGAVKAVPGGNIIMDGIENATKKDIITGAPEQGHDKLVWIAELIGLVGLLAFLVSKGIIPQDVLLQVIDAIKEAI